MYDVCLLVVVCCSLRAICLFVVRSLASVVCLLSGGWRVLYTGCLVCAVCCAVLGVWLLFVVYWLLNLVCLLFVGS